MKSNKIARNALVLLMLTGAVFAAGTPCGTDITNQAFGDYKDANGNNLPQVTSNVVTTTVSQIAGVDIAPAYHSNTIPTLSTHLSFMTLTNTGNCTDVFDLSISSVITGTGTFSTELYHDIDGNGIIDGLDSLITVTPSLDADEEISLIYVITDTTPGGAEDGVNVYTEVTAVSQFDNNVSDTASADHTIAASTLAISVTPDNTTPEPGEVITYSVCGENNGSATAYNVTIIGEIPANTTYVPGSMGIYPSNDYGNANPLTDIDDGVEYPPLTEGDYDMTNTGQITVVWGDAAPGESGCIFYQVVVNDDVEEGTEITADVTVEFENLEGTPYPDGNYTSGVSTVDQVYDVSVTDDLATVADPSDQVLFPVCFTNDGNGEDIFNITYSSDFWTWTFYWDFNGNGDIDPGDIALTDSPDDPDGIVDLGTLNPGETECIIAVATVPAGTNDGTVEEATITATSVGDPTVTVGATVTVTVTAPSLSLTKTVTPVGNQPPGTILTYRVDIINSGSGVATQVVITDAIPNNTTYVAGTMTLAGVPKTDANDSDSGTFSNNSVTFNIPSLGPGGSTYVTFQVEIN